MNSSSTLSAFSLVLPASTVPPSSPATRRAVMLTGGALLGLSAALALRGLFQLDTLAAAPFAKSPALPHLALISATPKSGLAPDVARLFIPGALIGHAVLVGLAGVVGLVAGRRAKHAAGTPWLTLALGTFAFYLAHFSFVHPGARLAVANPFLLALDFAAALSLGVCLWATLRFVLRFPAPFDARRYEDFQISRLTQAEAEGAASRFALRRWLARHTAEGRAKNQKFDRWRLSMPLRLQATLGAPIFGTLMAMALGLSMLGSLRGNDVVPAVAACAAMIIALMALTMVGALSAAVLSWHAQAAAPAARRTARVLLVTLTTALALIPIGMFGSITVGALAESWRTVSLSALALPLGTLLTPAVMFVALALTLWRAGEATTDA